ncbi:MAG: peptidase M14 [Acidobacteria bacterium]|nr:peptidase M14 [Acidobacteriota bacterium]
MRTRFWILLALTTSLWAAVPTPREHLGFTPGDEFKLADYTQIVSYFQKLEKASDRLVLKQFGRTSDGRPMYIAAISAPENLKQLERYCALNRRLALGEASEAEGRGLAAEGKAVVWIDSGLHASEVAPAQQAPDLAWRMVTGEDEETRRIRQNVILLQVPCINPDGLDWIVEWYRKNVGTPHELSPMPRLYQKYAGHDNNRDYFMLNLEETRQVSRLLFQEWFPQIVYNQHQQPAFPARIFIPPYAEPLNPNIPAPVMEGINVIGSFMAERFSRENKPGVLSYFGFDGWWNGGLRSVPAFHNMHGILTETAAAGYATPRVYQAGEIPERFSSGIPAREPSIFYQRPWMGGRWSVREAIDYMLTADFAILDLASARPSYFLLKAWELARASIEQGRKGKPFAYVVPMNQPDRWTAVEMLRRMSGAGVEVRQARAEFQAGGKSYPAGTYVMPAGQPFRPYLVDLMEPQKYPEIKTSGGVTKRPYDIAGWTLRMLMGVEVGRIEDPFDADLARVDRIGAAAPALDHRDNSSFLKTAELLRDGRPVHWSKSGEIQTGAASGGWQLRRPRLALYEPWTGNMDTGWTQWVLDTFQVPYTPIHNDDIRKSGLRGRFDSILFASQSAASILNGIRLGERSTSSQRGPEAKNAQPRPEHTGGIALAGLKNLDDFVREGGMLIALDGATELPMQHFPLPVRGLLRAGGEPADAFYCPGSILRMTVDNTHPLAFGMPSEAYLFTSGGQAFSPTLLDEYNQGDREVKAVAHYAKKDLLASGWVSGERAVLGRPALIHARHGKGSVVLFGFRPQFRGQTFGTFKLLLNAIYWASATAN